MLYKKAYVISLLLLFILNSCLKTTSLQEPKSSNIIKNIPFFPQEKYQCGPASLAGVLNYLGHNILPDTIAEDIYSEFTKGTLNIDMVLYAQKKGFITNQLRGNIKNIKSYIDEGHPVVVMVDYGFWVYKQNHFMVIIGYNEEGVIANSGLEEHKLIPFDEFEKIWGRAGYWTLVSYKKS